MLKSCKNRRGGMRFAKAGMRSMIQAVSLVFRGDRKCLYRCALLANSCSIRNSLRLCFWVETSFAGDFSEMSAKDDPRKWSEEDLWQVITANVTDYAIFMLSAEGKIATWNAGAERILGYTESEIIGHDFAEIFTPADHNKEQPQTELRLARERGRAEDERWHVRKDGSTFWASGVVTPLWDKNGGLRGFAKVLRDITHRKHLEEQLREENRRKDEFLAMLSHELRNPLSAVQNACQLLNLPDEAATIEARGIIQRQVALVIRMVDDLLDMSRVTTGKVKLRLEQVTLQQVL